MNISMRVCVVSPLYHPTLGGLGRQAQLLSERSLFVVKDVYAYLLPEYERRVSIRTQLFKNPKDAQVKQYLAVLNRPVYLLVDDAYNDPLMKGVEFDQVPEDSSEEFKLVFQNDKQRVYNIRLNK